MRIAERMTLSGGSTSGFDYMRLLLATAVLFWHSFVVVYGQSAGQAYHASAYGAFLRLILPMFFALSGFLVASSLERTRSLPIFLAFRTLRILPALAVEVTLSALIIGPLVTTASLTQYVSSPLFLAYFANVVGHVQYFLPGVFTDSPFPVVNASLWTVPYELECYIALLIVHGLTITRRPVWMAAVTVALSLGLFVFFRKETSTELAIDPVPGRMLIVCFLAGVSLHVGRAFIPDSSRLCVACGIAAVALLSLPGGQFLAALPVAYLTVWLGLRNPIRIGSLLSGDYSYGLYLYGFVIQQCLLYYFRDTIGSMMGIFVSSLLVTSLFAAFSWHVVERPMLRLKTRVAARWPRRPLPAPVPTLRRA